MAKKQQSLNLCQSESVNRLRRLLVFTAYANLDDIPEKD